MSIKALCLLCLIFSCSSFSQLRVNTIHQTTDELKIKKTLIKLYNQYDLRRWLYKASIQIDAKAKTPRSFPTVTMNTKAEYLNNETKLLSTFLHEQFHWHLIKNGKTTKEALRAAIKNEFSEIQYKPPQGSGTEGGTLSHIIVCYLEYKVLSHLIGIKKARENLSTNNYYLWIYKTVLNSDNHQKLERLINKHGLSIEIEKRLKTPL